ncbi:MAG: ATP-binding protein, partial [Pseudomonadota bacterium]
TGEGAAPSAARNPAILYGLGNLVENAVEFADGEVFVTADWDSEQVTLAIADDGPGFAPEIIDRIGDPYVTTRSRGTIAGSGHSHPARRHGLGLGVFIAKTLLERTGATIRFANRRAPEHGARITVTWLRSNFDRTDEDEPQQKLDENDGSTSQGTGNLIPASR